jgi:ribose transport system substrate-binding protein
VLGNTYVDAVRVGLEEVAKRSNARLQVFDGQFDPQKQFRQVQDATASGRYDAFIITAFDSVSVVPALEDAAKTGIKVVAENQPIGPRLDTVEPQYPWVSGSTFTPSTVAAKHTAGQILAACAQKDPCKVVWLAGLLSSPIDRGSLKVVRDAIRSKPNIEIVATPEGRYLADPAYKAMQNALQAHGDAAVVATTGDQMAVGAEKAVQDAGLQGKIDIIGGGASQPGVQAVREGRWRATTLYLPVAEGRIAMEMAVKAARGETISPKGVNPVDTTDLPPVLTRENVAEWSNFRSQWKG